MGARIQAGARGAWNSPQETMFPDSQGEAQDSALTRPFVSPIIPELEMLPLQNKGIGLAHQVPPPLISATLPTTVNTVAVTG